MNKNIRNQYIGCFPCDKLPAKIHRYPAALIANNDPATKRGSHWVAIFITENRHLYYFDSLGKKPNKCIENFLRKYPIIIRNKSILQSMFSDYCGHYCIYFIYKMCSSSKGYKRTYESLLENLFGNKNPDLYVYKFVKNLIKNGG